MGSVVADALQCAEMASVPVSSETSARLVSQTTKAWRLEDDRGAEWLVVFGIASLPETVLMPGDIVDLDYGTGGLRGGGGGASGRLIVERDGAPAVLVFSAEVPRVASLPDLSVEPTQAECLHDACFGRSAIRITAGGDSAVLATDESKVVGGLVFINDFFEPAPVCPSSHPNQWFVVAGYRPR